MAGSPPRAWAWAAIVALSLLMTLGNVVSAAGSGLGCPTAGLAAVFLQLALGGYVGHAGAGPACPGVPLCSGRLLPHGRETWLSVHAECWRAVARGAEAPAREIIGRVARAS